MTEEKNEIEQELETFIDDLSDEALDRDERGRIFTAGLLSIN